MFVPVNSEHVTPGKKSGHLLMWLLSWLSASLSEGLVMGQGVEAVALVAHMSEQQEQIEPPKPYSRAAPKACCTYIFCACHTSYECKTSPSR